MAIGEEGNMNKCQELIEILDTHIGVQKQIIDAQESSIRDLEATVGFQTEIIQILKERLIMAGEPGIIEDELLEVEKKLQ